MPSDFMQNIKKRYELILSNIYIYKKVHFLRLFVLLKPTNDQNLDSLSSFLKEILTGCIPDPENPENPEEP